jgi:uncharacterized repeat protein (TIGR03833 family)
MPMASTSKYEKHSLFFLDKQPYISSNSPNIMNPGSDRKNIKIGLRVGIVLKQDQKSGKITTGIVKRILTNSPSHPHGIKVQLQDGRVGRVKEIHSGE